MSEAGAKKTQKKRGRRWAVRALIVLGVLLVAAWFFRERIAAYAVRRAARAAGIEVAWSGLSIDGISRVRLADARARRAGDLDVAADHIGIEFDLFMLARGDLGGIERVTVAGLRGFAGPFQGAGGEAQGKSTLRLPSRWPVVQVVAPAFELRLPKERRVAVTDLAVAFNGVEASAEARSLAWIDRDQVESFPLDVRGSFHGDRFEIERATWDPRIVLENARFDVDDNAPALVRFEGGVAAFGGRARLQGRLDDGVVYVAGRVNHLDLDELARAYAPHLLGKAAGVFDVRLSASLPIADPLALECSLEIAARDARVVRAFDELSCSVTVTARGIEVAEGLVVHGENAIRFAGRAPPLGTAACDWLGKTELFCDGVLGDVRALLGVDIGLALRDDSSWQLAPVFVSAAYHHGNVAAHVRAPAADLGPIVSAFAGQTPVEGTAELEADVHLNVFEAAHLAVEGVIVGEYARVLDHPVDMFVTRVHWDRTELTLEDLSVAAGVNRLGAAWIRIPRTFFGSCATERLSEITVRRLRARLDDLPALMHGHETNPTFDRLRAHRLVFEGGLEGGDIVLERGDFATRDGVGRIERGRIPLLADARSILRDPALDLELALRFDGISEVVAALAPEAFAAGDLPRGSVAGTARVRGHAAGPNASLDLTAREIFVRGAYFDELDVRADLDERSLRIERADSRGSLGVFTLSGEYVFADERIVDGRLEADLLDLSRLAPAHLPSGAVQARVHANGKLGSVDGEVNVSGRDLVWKDVRVDELTLAARAVNGEWAIAEAIVRGHGLEASLSGRVSSLAPSAATRRIDLDTLSVTASDAGVALAQAATIVQDGDRWTVEGFVLEGTAGKGRIAFEHDGTQAQLDVVFAAPLPRAALALLGIESKDAAVDAVIKVTKRGPEFLCLTSGTVSPLDALDPGATHLRWKAELRDRRVTIEEFVFGRGTGERRSSAQVTGQFPLDPFGAEVLAGGALALRVALDTPDLALLPFVRSGWGVSGGGKITAELGGAWSGVTGSIDAQLERAAAAGVRGLAELGRITGSTRIVLAENSRLDAADIGIDDTVFVRAAGSIDAPLDVRAFARGDFERVKNAALDVAVRVDAEDLGPVASRIPTLRRTRGRVHAEVRAAGTLAAPKFTGEGTLAEGEIRTTTNLPSIVGVMSSVHFDGTHLVVDDLAGEMGGAPFTMQGRVRVSGDAPEVDLKLKGSSLLLWRERDVTVRADADLTLSGPLGALTLAGDLALRDGRFTKRFDILSLGKRGPQRARGRGLRLFALEEPPFSTMRFDVRVTSATPFKISSNLVRGGLSPTLYLHGTGALPELRGTILIEPTRVLLPTGSVAVRSGRIEFTPAQPDVPELDIHATARIQGYDISITVSGSYDDPRIELSSVPPVSREDLALLIIAGTPPGDTLSSTAGQRAAMDLAVYIARDVAVAWFEADEDDVESIAERLEVVVGADTTKSGADVVLVRFRLSGDLLEGRRAMFLTGEKDVYEFYNFGLRFVLAFQ